MPRPKNPLPTYLRHPSGRARVAWTDPAGTRRFKLLPGSYDSAESRAAYRAFLAEFEAAPHAAARPDPTGLTLNELMLAYLRHVDRYYRGPDGRPTDEPRHVRTVCRYLRESYGDTPATAFGPLALKAVRQQFLNARWCRATVNRRTARVVQIFKWAAAEELLPPAVHQALATVGGRNAPANHVRSMAKQRGVAHGLRVRRLNAS